MFLSTITSELLADLSSDEQQLLAGGKCCCSDEPVTPPLSSGVRLVVGKIITMTPFISCSPEEETGVESGAEGAMGDEPQGGFRSRRGRSRSFGG